MKASLLTQKASLLTLHHSRVNNSISIFFHKTFAVGLALCEHRYKLGGMAFHGVHIHALGGKASAAKLTAKQRSEKARRAALARYAKRLKKAA